MKQKTGHTCPLCGGPNECAVAETGDNNAPCWCRDAAINPLALARAGALTGKPACLCRKCAAAADGKQDIPSTK